MALRIPFCYNVNMKIAIFSDCYLDLTGGIVSAINAQKSALEKRGHTVYVFSTGYKKSDAELKKLASQNIFMVPSCKIFFRGLTPVSRRPAIIEKWLLKTHPEIKDFDIYYIHYESGCSIAGLRLGKKLHIPTVQVMHGREDMGEEKLIPFGLRTFVAMMLNWFHSWYLPHPVKVHSDDYLANTIAKAKMWTMMVNHANYADLVLTPSEHFRKKLIHYGVKKTIIALHHGVKEELLDLNIQPCELLPGETMKIIWHSRVSGEKRIMTFLKALDILQQKCRQTNYEVLIYGDGPDLKRARRYARRHHLKTKFYGNTKFDKVWPQILKSHLDVLISYNYDTFGMTLIEAAAAGVPTLIVDPDMKEILPPESYVLATGPTPSRIAQALNELLNHPEKINNMSNTLLSYQNNLKISHQIQKLEQVFNDIIKP